MVRGAAVVVKRFPSLSDEIEACFGTSPEFRGLCQDLAAAYATLDHLQGQEAPWAIARADEYRHLIVSLETEVLRYVAQQAVPSPKAS